MQALKAWEQFASSDLYRITENQRRNNQRGVHGHMPSRSYQLGFKPPEKNGCGADGTCTYPNNSIFLQRRLSRSALYLVTLEILLWHCEIVFLNAIQSIICPTYNGIIIHCRHLFLINNLAQAYLAYKDNLY